MPRIIAGSLPVVASKSLKLLSEGSPLSPPLEGEGEVVVDEEVLLESDESYKDRSVESGLRCSISVGI